MPGSEKYNVDLISAHWMKSPFSNQSGGNCVEIARIGELTAVRDSRNLDRPPLVFDEQEWSAFTQGIRAGLL